jgi:hypothetical protein
MQQGRSTAKREMMKVAKKQKRTARKKIKVQPRSTAKKKIHVQPGKRWNKIHPGVHHANLGHESIKLLLLTREMHQF